MCLVGSQLYFERLRKLDSDIAFAEARKARLGLALRSSASLSAQRKAWTAVESTPEGFLSHFDRTVRSAGWKTVSTIFRGRKDRISIFSLSVEGPNTGWERLLESLDAWEKQVVIESIEASASGKGRMRADFEAGYATE
jgi:hypothetical protein